MSLRKNRSQYENLLALLDLWNISKTQMLVGSLLAKFITTNLPALNLELWQIRGYYEWQRLYRRQGQWLQSANHKGRSVCLDLPNGRGCRQNAALIDPQKVNLAATPTRWANEHDSVLFDCSRPRQTITQLQPVRTNPQCRLASTADMIQHLRMLFKQGNGCIGIKQINH